MLRRNDAAACTPRAAFQAEQLAVLLLPLGNRENYAIQTINPSVAQQRWWYSTIAVGWHSIDYSKSVAAEAAEALPATKKLNWSPANRIAPRSLNAFAVVCACCITVLYRARAESLPSTLDWAKCTPAARQVQHCYHLEWLCRSQISCNSKITSSGRS